MIQNVLGKQSLYQQLVADIQSLSQPNKQALNHIYTEFSKGITPNIEKYPPITMHNKPNLVSIDSQGGRITACFGCYCESKNHSSHTHSTEHLVDWLTGRAYAWCIWDALFIAKTVGKPATITSTDPISHEQIKIYFDGVRFDSNPLWFSFPLGSLQTKDSIRSCFCCRTKAFTSLATAKSFAKEHQCEVVNLAQMLERTDQMVNALKVA